MSAPAKNKKLGYYRKSKKSNQRLIELFESDQEVRLKGDWESEKFIEKLVKDEKKARQEVREMLRRKKIKTADDFYRAALILHHGQDFQSYALAVALAAVSHHLGEPWGKSFYATTIDRFLISVGHPQYFGTQLEKRKSRWVIASYNKQTTDQERKEYLGESLKKIKREIEKLNQTKKGK